MSEAEGVVSDGGSSFSTYCNSHSGKAVPEHSARVGMIARNVYLLCIYFRFLTFPF